MSRRGRESRIELSGLKSGLGGNGLLLQGPTRDELTPNHLPGLWMDILDTQCFGPTANPTANPDLSLDTDIQVVEPWS